LNLAPLGVGFDRNQGCEPWNWKLEIGKNSTKAWIPKMLTERTNFTFYDFIKFPISIFQFQRSVNAYFYFILKNPVLRARSELSGFAWRNAARVWSKL